ncbi:universal stress protein [Streptomyces sp. NRRL F-5630]|uniref:universal stress protein n=1 Tax=unclassified Streptomyces TaxID=2593676 RepID=UPI0004C9FF9E|nr:universal stress protein [Streptomyces sp. NRRL F-5630]
MSRTIVLGYDGSPESTAAADWAAEEALRTEAFLRVVYAWEWQPYSLGITDATPDGRAFMDELPVGEAERLMRRYRGLRAGGERVSGAPATALIDMARSAALLVVGSRGLGKMHGFVVGSVAQSVIARAVSPVALVRPGTHLPEAGPPEGGEVLLGHDLRHPARRLLDAAFEAADRRGAPLRVVHAWPEPRALPGAATDPDTLRAEESARTTRLRNMLAPWRESHPHVTVRAQAVAGKPTDLLLQESHHAQLLLVGRRTARHGPLGPRIGHVTQAAMQHAVCPVEVVPEEEGEA